MSLWLISLGCCWCVRKYAVVNITFESTVSMQQVSSPSPTQTTIVVASSNSSTRGSSPISEVQPRPGGAAARPCRPKYRRKKSARDRLIEAQKAEEESKLYNLVLDTNSFKQQIHELTVRRDLLLARAQSESRQVIASTVRTYFERFKHGYQASDLKQRDFVHSIASDNFRLGQTAMGIDMLLEQWRRYTVVFEIQDVNLISTDRVLLDSPSFENARGCAVFKCAAEFHGVFTQVAVDTVFPNARTKLWQLLQALGSDMVCPMLFHVYFDWDGKFLRQDLASDFFSAITNLLGGDTLLARCFLDGARVGEESTIENTRR